MPKSEMVSIDHLEVSRRDIEKLKRAFKVKDDSEALIKALDLAAGKIGLEEIFEKHRGVRIKKVYA